MLRRVCVCVYYSLVSFIFLVFVLFWFGFVFCEPEKELGIGWGGQWGGPRRT